MAKYEEVFPWLQCTLPGESYVPSDEAGIDFFIPTPNEELLGKLESMPFHYIAFYQGEAKKIKFDGRLVAGADGRPAPEPRDKRNIPEIKAPADRLG